MTFDMKRRKGEAGNILILTAFVLPVMLGFTALALDAGYLFEYRQQMRIAADAAALAAAFEVKLNPNISQASLETYARTDATRNGFTNGTNGVTVTVNRPPSSGPFMGNTRYVEVIVSRPVPTFLMQILGPSSMTVGVRAVAGAGDYKGCVYVLGTSGATLQVGAPLTAYHCDIIVNSSGTPAISGGGRIRGSVIDVTGTIDQAPATGQVFAGVPPQPDPFASLPAPAVDPCVAGFINVHFSSGSHTLPAGTYCGGISIDGSATATFSGTYVLNGGGLRLGGNAHVTGTGVTFYVTESPPTYPYGPIRFSDGANGSLSAPTDGPYEGILFFDTTGTSSTIQDMQANIICAGVLYFPTSGIKFQAGSGPYMVLVALTVDVGSNVTMGIDYSSLSHGSPVKRISLGE